MITSLQNSTTIIILISRLLSWTDPDDPPQPSPTKTTANQGPPPLPYNPYAPKNKPADDSVINYNGRQQRQPTSITSLPMHNLANQVASTMQESQVSHV